MDDSFSIAVTMEAPLQLIFHTLHRPSPPRSMRSSTAGAEFHTAGRDIEEEAYEIDGDARMTLL